MKIWIHRYQLKPIQRLNSLSGGESRQGALVRVEFPDIGFGHADIHPWIELGDESIDRQIAKLASNILTPLTAQSLRLARDEAVAICHGRSLYPEVKMKNNFVISDAVNFNTRSLEGVQNQGFEIIKLKAGMLPSAEYAIIKMAHTLGLKVRLDFNAKLNKFSFEEYFKHLSADLLQSIEYIEDPYVFDQVSWAVLNSKIPLALDNQCKSLLAFKDFKQGDLSFEFVPNTFLSTKDLVAKGDFRLGGKESSAFSVLVVKPARTNVDKALEECGTFALKSTITSYMDHPVGVLHSWAQALKAKQKFPSQVLQAGCATLDLYEPTDFSQLVVTKNASLVPPSGLGLGFSNLLEKLSWQMI